ncbi:MAG: hypothetical protein J7641_03980 [Cyanobacteria bacterium SID2]|nr:hypothetical protein [Cyanobacteria bacterium SID2]
MNDFEDFTIGDENANEIIGAELADTIVGLSGDDTLFGGLNDDILSGNAGLDSLAGGEGNDLIVAGRDGDNASGGADNDIIAGNLGSDTLSGDEGDDLILGGQDADVLIGGVGNDTLSGDFGVNVLKGDEGADVFIVRTDVALSDPNRLPSSSQFRTDVIVDFDGTADKIALTDGLTESDVALTVTQLPTQLVEPLFQSGEQLSDVNLDPNNDGLVDATFVQIPDGPVLALMFNVTSADLTGNFISI